MQCFTSRLTRLGLLIILLFAVRLAPAAPTDWTTTSASGTSALWPASNSYDNNTATQWSSNTHTTAQSFEGLAYWLDTFHSVNYVKLATRFDGTSALGFPVEFTVNWSDGTNWNVARSFTHYPRPTSQWVTLTLPNTVNANGIYITAKVLGDDKSGNYVFQIAEAKAGYDPDLNGIEYTANSATASSTLTGWPTTNAYDGNAGSSWSSNTHASAGFTEWLAYWWPQGMQNINYVKILPRYNGANALCFPVTFNVFYSNGSQWILGVSYSNFSAPYRGDWIVLPLPSTVLSNGIYIQATTLGNDGVGNYAFQLAEVKAGYNAAFNQFSFISNDGSGSRNEIRGIGSQSINRADQLGNWNYDDRGIVLNPNSGTYRNIYAPQIVYQAGSFWNIYFGGWDGSSSQNDRLYMTTTADNFMTMGAHAMIINNGAYTHVNNDSVFKVAGNDWRMVYTTYLNGGYNKPCYATSPDGGTWTPNAGNSAYLLRMNGYANWPTADVNGGNTIFKDAGGTWHLFFNNFNDWPGVHHATSSDMVNFNYQGKAANDGVVMNDFKAFTYGGSTYYISAYHMNGQNVWTSVNTNTSTLGPLSVAFSNAGTADKYIVAPGIVQDGSRLYGILYGAGAASSLDQNRIFARWLQKRVIFQNANVRWGDIEFSNGPDRIHLNMAGGQNVETGRFYVYDTDGTTLLYVSPTVTMRQGDIWNYTAGY